MENRGLVAATILVSILIFPHTAGAYEVSAHGELTRATLQLYEAQRGDVFSADEERKLVDGSKDEDDAFRFLNHFYDPVHGNGVPGNAPSIEWATDIVAQANWGLGKLGIGGLKQNDVLFSGDNDYTWERAVYEYVHGDKARAAAALGHVLHLVQDATVPAHVRDDLHPYGFSIGDRDLHEAFTKDIDAADIIKSVGDVQPEWFSSIATALEDTATFTQEHFMSKDTLFKEYEKPSRDSVTLERSYADGENQYFGAAIYGKIVRIKLERKWASNTRDETYSLDDAENKILIENWEALSRRAVAANMGVLDLFFREVAQEEQSGALLAMNKSRSDTEHFVKSLAMVRDSSKGMLASLTAADVYELNKSDLDGYFAAAKAYDIAIPAVARDSVLKEEDNKQPANALMAFDQAKQSIIGEELPEGTPIVIQPETVEEEPAVSEEEPEAVVEEDVLEEEAVAVTEDETKEDTEETKVELPSLEPGSGGYGGGGSATQHNSDENELDDTADTVAAPMVLTPVLGTPLATTTVTFSGTGIEGYTLTGTIGTTTATTTVATDGTWLLGPFTLEEGIVTTSFFQTSSENEDSETVAMDVTVDITSPSAPTLTVLECVYTLREDGECLSGSSEVHLAWDEQEEATYFAIVVDDTELATTSATSTTVALNDEATSRLSVVAYDAAGNSASSNEEEVTVFANPIVITEVAWGGTAASADDEWIELYNRTDHVLTLQNIQLEARDGSPSIQLAGTIGTGDYWTDHAYLIERGDGSATSKSEDLATDFDALSDSGEELVLQFTATSTFLTELDATPSTDACGGWCGGSNSGTYYSMERIDVDAPGSDASNWQSNDGYPVVNEYYDARGYEYGSDRKVYGTVKQESSKGYPEFGYFCEPYTESFEDGGTYAPSVPGNISTKNCTYLAGLWATPTNFSAAGALYKGTVGSSTSIAGHQLGSMLSTQNGDIVDSLENGDNVFVAMWKQYTGSSHADDGAAFGNYFTGAATSTPPHNEYRVLEWIFSE